MSNNIGERNRLLRIDALTGTVDEANQPIEQWTEIMTRWGKPLTASGMSIVKGGAQGVDAPIGRYSWRINYTPSITTANRARWKGMIFDIVDVRHDIGGQEYTDLVCNENANNG